MTISRYLSKVTARSASSLDDDDEDDDDDRTIIYTPLPESSLDAQSTGLGPEDHVK